MVAARPATMAAKVEMDIVGEVAELNREEEVDVLLLGAVCLIVLDTPFFLVEACDCFIHLVEGFHAAGILRLLFP